MRRHGPAAAAGPGEAAHRVSLAKIKNLKKGMSKNKNRKKNKPPAPPLYFGQKVCPSHGWEGYTGAFQNWRNVKPTCLSSWRPGTISAPHWRALIREASKSMQGCIKHMFRRGVPAVFVAMGQRGGRWSRCWRMVVSDRVFVLQLIMVSFEQTLGSPVLRTHPRAHGNRWRWSSQHIS